MVLHTDHSVGAGQFQGHRPKPSRRRLIYQHRKEIEMQIAVLDKPEHDILKLLDAMLLEGNPPWNVPNGHHHLR